MSARLFDTPPKLTSPDQQWVYDNMAHAKGLKAGNVGFALHLHNHCRFCTPLEPCKFAATRGRQVLESLRKKGLMKRDRHHVYRRADQPSTQPADSDPFPEDF